nr:MAG: hypothetical protein [Bacteriophage sp.]
MKVVIELLGNESKQDLLATSNYLRELAGEAVPEVTERKTDLDKLADTVVEATKVREESAPVKTVAEHVEEERAKTRASRTKKVEEPAPAPIEEPEEAPAPVEEAPKAPINYTVEECKQWAMKALNAKKRQLVQEAFEKVGATSFPTLKESMFAEFIEYISTRL